MSGFQQLDELTRDMRVRSAATTAVAQLLIRLADHECDWLDFREAFGELGERLNLNSTLLMMACSPWDFEAGRPALALLEALRGEQPRDELLRLYFELGDKLGVGVCRLASEAHVRSSGPVGELLDAVLTLVMGDRDVWFEDTEARQLLGAVARIIRSMDLEDYDNEVSRPLLDVVGALEAAAREPE